MMKRRVLQENHLKMGRPEESKATGKMRSLINIRVNFIHLDAGISSVIGLTCRGMVQFYNLNRLEVRLAVILQDSKSGLS